MSDAVLDWLRQAGLADARPDRGQTGATAWLQGGRPVREIAAEAEPWEEPENAESGAGTRSTSSIFLPGNSSTDYPDYVRPATAGTATMLINGRSSGGSGPNVDSTEPLDRMQATVQSLRAGDRVYLSAWFFEPATALTRGPYGAAATWGALLARRADEGVIVRLLINDFDPISRMDRWLQDDDLDKLNPLIAGLPATRRDNLKYVVSLHPANVGALKALFATGRFGRSTSPATTRSCRHGCNCAAPGVDDRKPELTAIHVVPIELNALDAPSPDVYPRAGVWYWTWLVIVIVVRA
jgi:hypothetical protein